MELGFGMVVVVAVLVLLLDVSPSLVCRPWPGRGQLLLWGCCCFWRGQASHLCSSFSMDEEGGGLIYIRSILMLGRRGRDG